MDKIIAYTVNSHLDKIRFTFRMSQFNYFKNLFTNTYGKPRYTRGKHGEPVYQYRYDNNKLLELVDWSRHYGSGAIVIHDPDAVIQEFFKQFAFLVLNQIELALDFTPDNPSDLYTLKQTLSHIVVLRHMRAGAFNPYKNKIIKQSHIHSTTAYTGRKGDTRKSNIGLKIYTKPDREFVRLEINLNRQAIKRKRLTLPIDINTINLYDFITTRNNLDVEKLVSVIVKGVKNADEYLLPQITSWISCTIRNGPVIQQIEDFKQIDGIGYRVDEFFSKTANILNGSIEILYQNLP